MRVLNVLRNIKFSLFPRLLKKAKYHVNICNWSPASDVESRVIIENVVLIVILIIGSPTGNIAINSIWIWTTASGVEKRVIITIEFIIFGHIKYVISVNNCLESFLYIQSLLPGYHTIKIHSSINEES